jgi:hypothetical protein
LFIFTVLSSVQVTVNWVAAPFDWYVTVTALFRKLSEFDCVVDGVDGADVVVAVDEVPVETGNTGVVDVDVAGAKLTVLVEKSLAVLW